MILGVTSWLSRIAPTTQGRKIGPQVARSALVRMERFGWCKVWIVKMDIQAGGSTKLQPPST
ncbi:hypothetical protein STH2240 [Symbiobacterium thermophilum IAM 14863]|uniref:Uncharacterized protein n=1 Tax=Symbiobacterium thermophilum (strain DSM 24528 / JCM 14929 / IAM 14863 / T) TaxID=292459 RepID=Q67M70_SYMTH|nr:hypothetical protein STH2240 [Symbiobacterium thermophilum IAM 14863]